MYFRRRFCACTVVTLAAEVLSSDEISPPVSVRDFLETCKATLPEEILLGAPTERIDEAKLAAEMELEVITFKAVKRECSLSKLKASVAPEDFRIGAFQLATLQQNNVARTEMKPYTQMINPKRIVAKDALPVKYPDVVLAVTVFNQVKKDVKPFNEQKHFLVLASQPLTALKDVITCSSDLPITDQSEMPEEASLDAMKSASGFFFIEDVFYNDTRDPQARDYSRIIIDWAKAKGEAIKNLGISPKSSSMEEVTFADLTVRLGFPYLYCHQGNCEHVIIFRDIRLLHPDDPPRQLNYPHLTFMKRPRKTRCYVCKTFQAHWITTDDELAPEDPCYFCKKCFDALHYKDDRSKACNFRAYLYADLD
ncbi:snRNA-activating protein complex subunit 3-like [Oscarella lobularis]|uniref:snRNA-activating protein complex subunit 3-like n=1 Tax=Oscarella lobularis TaxID=121494 RepID=UPI003313185C